MIRNTQTLGLRLLEQNNLPVDCENFVPEKSTVNLELKAEEPFREQWEPRGNDDSWRNTERKFINSGGSRIFRWGGAPSRWGGGANLQRGYSSAKMYAKTKELDPVGGARAGGAPP